ncbi:MAG: SDR family NAD(P)-dependent oxidoreductase, partial [Pseudomonadota bacterium]
MPQKVAVVTGAARGIGLATVRLMVSQGVDVAMVDRDVDELAKASKDLGLALPYDISDPDQVEQMVGDVLQHFGRLDTLVNNAAVADFGPIEETTFERWRRVMETNLDGVFLCSQAATP